MATGWPRRRAEIKSEPVARLNVYWHSFAGDGNTHNLIHQCSNLIPKAQSLGRGKPLHIVAMIQYLATIFRPEQYISLSVWQWWPSNPILLIYTLGVCLVDKVLLKTLGVFLSVFYQNTTCTWIICGDIKKGNKKWSSRDYLKKKKSEFYGLLKREELHKLYETPCKF